jgi:hypothetical protein
MDKIGFSVYFIFTDPQGLEEIHRTMEAFVDDTDVAVNDATKKYTTTELAQVLQTDAQHWEKLLFTSGGKLELSKCFFYIMYWTFSEDGIPRLTPESNIPHKLMLHQGNDNEPTKIEQKDCHHRGTKEVETKMQRTCNRNIKQLSHHFRRRTSLLSLSSYKRRVLTWYNVHYTKRV